MNDPLDPKGNNCKALREGSACINTQNHLYLHHCYFLSTLIITGYRPLYISIKCNIIHSLTLLIYLVSLLHIFKKEECYIWCYKFIMHINVLCNIKDFFLSKSHLPFLVPKNMSLFIEVLSVKFASMIQWVIELLFYVLKQQRLWIVYDMTVLTFCAIVLWSLRV